MGLFGIAMIAFSVAPIVNHLRGLQNKDYNLWYATGQLALHGGLIYPTDHRPFPFMYPPGCAALLAIAGLVGELPFIVLLLVANSAAWAGCILLSVYLATGRVWGQHPLLYVGPTLVVIPFVHDMYLLGQPALGLLLCLLGAFACLRTGRPWTAGGLVALAAAIKAYPILALGLLVYRRQWKATIATVLALVLLLLVLPMPFRGVHQSWADLSTWTRGMVLKYDKDTIAQRPERSYSFKNQSLIALANRLLRAVPANGEAKDGWRVNVADLDFRATNAAIVGVSLALCAFYLAVMPRYNLRTERTDAIEAGMLLLLIQAFNPLSFDYSFVWLIYPLTLAVALIREAPAPSRQHSALIGGLAMAILVFGLSLPFRRVAQAYGNLLIADLVLLVLLGWQLYLAGRTLPRQGAKPSLDHSL
ncbi:MAG: glycosyltransferase family 87 protein [Isosphaeraceae bacterium]|nr:glycosyltransferase family 87 protein [Isosphaeraceae bacterium]